MVVPPPQPQPAVPWDQLLPGPLFPRHIAGARSAFGAGAVARAWGQPRGGERGKGRRLFTEVRGRTRLRGCKKGCCHWQIDPKGAGGTGRLGLRGWRVLCAFNI